jgi:phosphate uptake regulator
MYIYEYQRHKTYKVRTRGQRSSEVTLPPQWLKDNDIKVGDEVVSERQDDGTLVYMTRAQYQDRLEASRAAARA